MVRGGLEYTIRCVCVQWERTYSTLESYYKYNCNRPIVGAQ